MTRWEFAVLCLGMVLLILASTARAQGTDMRSGAFLTERPSVHSLVE